jgi:predicted transcriptional regulator
MIHLELQPEIEAQLTAEAQARGLARDRYIESIVAARAIASGPEQALDEAQLSCDLQQGLREIAEGDTLPARQVFAQLREEYDIRG